MNAHHLHTSVKCPPLGIARRLCPGFDTVIFCGRLSFTARAIVRTMKARTITGRSSTTLARTLGLGPREAQEWQVQHALLKRLQHIVRDQSLTHAEVARRGGSSRTRVTSILNGNLDNVSSDLLIRLLAGLGYRVKVSVTRAD